jgi:hypothetical protein
VCGRVVWPRRLALRCGPLIARDMGPDATQPRVTVRPKPPVLLGATSETNRQHRVWDRVGQSQSGPGLGAPGKSPFRHTARLLPKTSSRSGRELLAELNADPRSGLAAFSRPPSGPPCGGPSGFPSSCLAAVRRGSAGFRLRTGATLRFLSQKVNAISRNPDVLPTFSPVIPSGTPRIPNSSPCVPERRNTCVAPRGARADACAHNGVT